jgi:2-methylaconitate cis-trans-isomerase PrpF
MKKIRGIFMRGGTSKGVYFHANDLPTDKALRDKVILDVYGSPDMTQIDGLGGANVLTSKTAIISVSDRSDADIDYTFGQVMFNEALVDYTENCGNISSGVGPFAIDEGLVKAVEPITKIRIFNTNTQKIIIAEVEVENGKAKVAGDYHIDGVPNSGSKISLDFAQTGGTQGKGILPTGNAIEKIIVDGVGEIEVSIVDAANPSVFVRTKDVGLKDNETFGDILSDAKIADMADRIRGTVGVMLGMYKDLDSFLKINPTTPFCTFVCAPIDYTNFVTSDKIDASSYDLKCIQRFAGAYHRAYAGTDSICTAVASRIDGTIANEALSNDTKKSNVLRIGHPSGIMEVEIDVAKNGNLYEIKRAVFGRTARRIMEGYIYLKPWADTVPSL